MRPRRPFGTDLPGRLPATLLKVIAAEMSDSSRLARGKRLHVDGAVIDLIVGSGTVNAEVQGSRSQPYVVTIETEPGTGAPSRHDLYAQCSCPDDEGYGTTACKHVVATLFALADEVSIEPEILARWRGGRARLRVVRDQAPLGEHNDSPHDTLDDTPVPHLRAVTDLATVSSTDPLIDPAAAVFGAPDHALPTLAPMFGDVPPLVYRHHPNRQLDELLTSALKELNDAF